MAAATTGLGYQLWDETISTMEFYSRLLMTASTQYYDGDACILTDGILGQVSSQTALPTHIFTVMITPSTLLRPGSTNLSTTVGERCLAVPVTVTNALKFYTPLTGNAAPTINGTAANANSTATSVLVTFTGSTNDFATGTVYIPSLQQQRTITADVVSGGVHTFTVTPPFSRAVTTGDTVVAVPFSPGSTGIKLNATVNYQQISTAVADKTGGHVNIQGVSLGIQAPNPDNGNSSSGTATPYAIVTFS